MNREPFAAVLLAGGRSRRMGRDKALIPLPDGRMLWERQLAVLRALEPEELFISGPARAGFPADVPVLADDRPGCGPLAGIATALHAMRSPRLVALAIDLPAMTAEFLRGLLCCEADTRATDGSVPRMADGLYEPLAAVYPHEALTAADDALRGQDWSLQTFVRELTRRGLVRAFPVAAAQTGLFANWNEAGDLPR